MTAHVDGYWWSNDGLRLHYRDYAGDSDRAPLICLPGLTRNARDFHALAQRTAPARRVIAVEFRGRGESAYARDPMTYVPLTYVQDLARLVDALALQRVVLAGTSLGGLVAMLFASTDAKRVAGLILNDVGPELEAAGLTRIRTLIGRSTAYQSWVEAARALREQNAGQQDGYELQDWIDHAKRLLRVKSSGRIVPDYDPKIAEPLRAPGGEGVIDLWPALRAAREVPTLILRGERSDVLAAEAVTRMLAELADAQSVTVAGVGHAPTLDEPAARAAVAGFLARLP